MSLTTMGNSTLSMISHALRHEHIVIKHLRSKAAQSLFGICKSNLNPRPHAPITPNSSYGSKREIVGDYVEK